MDKLTEDYFVFQMDNIKIIALSCGDLIEDGWFRGIEKPEYERLLTSNGLIKEDGGVKTADTSFLIDDGLKIILIDAGSSYDGISETLANNIKKAGYSPTDISSILLTHLHDDHYLGLKDSAGNNIFPNATLYFSNKIGRNQLFNYPTETFGTNAQLFSNIVSVDLPGHYYGHTGYIIESNFDRKILFWGDVVQSFAIQLTNPDVYGIFDTNFKLANQTRKNILAKVVNQPILIGGNHMPFPSLGYIKNGKDQYVWKSLQ